MGGNLRFVVQNWNWDSDGVKYVIFEYKMPYILLSSGKEGIYHQIDTLRLGEIKPEFARIPVKWKIIPHIKDKNLYSEVTNLMNFQVQLRLTVDFDLVQSNAEIYNFDGSKWNYATTAGIFEYSRKMRTTFLPGETKKYCSPIFYPKELSGVSFIRYKLLYWVISTLTRGETTEEIALSMTNLKDENDIKMIYTKVDQMPHFPGGEKVLSAYFKNEIKNLKEWKKCGIMKVVVEKDGTVSFPCIVERNINGFDNNVLPVVLRMPQCVPAYVNGEPVRAFHDIVVDF